MSIKQRLSTCLWFDCDAEEAVTFYVSLFPNSRILSISRYSAGGRMEEGLAMLVRFELDGVEYAALNGGPMFKHSEAASIVALCEDQAELDRVWNALIADGGAESMCGWCKDRFGLSWQVLPAMLGDMMGRPASPGKARAWEGLMSMRKIDISALEKAYAG
ncbi:MAG: VOC family protein [Parvularculaceae bacterium]